MTELLRQAVEATGGPGTVVRWGQLRDYFMSQGMDRVEAEAFTGELLYEGVYVRADVASYTWLPDVHFMLRNRAWRFPRGQLDLASAIRFVQIIRERGDGPQLPEMLGSMYKRVAAALAALEWKG